MTKTLHILLLFVWSFSYAGQWLHSFEHLDAHEEAQCDWVLHANFQGLQAPPELEIILPVEPLQETAFVECECVSFYRVKHPYKNKAPPVELLRAVESIDPF